MVILSKSTGSSGGLSWEILMRRQNQSTVYQLVFVGSVDGVTSLEATSDACTSKIESEHHYALTWDRGTVTFYCDGKQKGTRSLLGTPAPLFNSTAPLRIGTRPNLSGTLPFKGKIDEIRISQGLRYPGSDFTSPTSPYSAD